MLWYSKYQDHETMMVTGQIFSICSEATASVGISEENCNHLISLKLLIAGMKDLEGK